MATGSDTLVVAPSGSGLAMQCKALLETHPLRAKPLIVTLLGDSIRPEGDGIWLSALIRMAAPFALSERVVRTAVFRLRREGWLSARREGRRSFYTLTPDARRQFETAERRIYTVPRNAWDGRWSLLILDPTIDAADRESLVRELRWAGFAPFASNILAYPARSADMPAAVMEDSGVGAKLLRLNCETLPGVDPDSVRRIIERNWELDGVRAGYEAFLHRYEPILEVLAASPHHRPKDAFFIRTLLIDDFRRILLKDPALPLPLLPAGWPGQAAAMLARNIYRIIGNVAQEHVRSLLKGEGMSTQTSQRFYARFGGL